MEITPSIYLDLILSSLLRFNSNINKLIFCKNLHLYLPKQHNNKLPKPLLKIRLEVRRLIKSLPIQDFCLHSNLNQISKIPTKHLSKFKELLKIRFKELHFSFNTKIKINISNLELEGNSHFILLRFRTSSSILSSNSLIR